MALSGIEREKLLLESGVREIFTPHKPIGSIEQLFGRETQVSQLVSNLNTPGQHALLYGDRGVGKSSLANVVRLHLVAAGLINGANYVKRCDKSDTFLNIFRKPLEDIGYSLELNSWEQNSSDKLGVGFKGFQTSRDKGGTSRFCVNANALGPSFVADALEEKSGLLLIDEADSLSDPEKEKIAQLIKLLGDNGSLFKILIVGTAMTGESLTASHQSVHRNLKEIRLKRMARDELACIIRGGSEKIKPNFEEDVIERIAEVSAGYPYFAHLIALKCAEEAIVEEDVTINLFALKSAFSLAVEEAEGTLKRTYDEVVRSHKTEGYVNTLLAAAQCEDLEFSTDDIRNNFSKIFKTQSAPKGLNKYLCRLVSDDDSKILRRISVGIYRFSDPRMSSYIRIANSEKYSSINASAHEDFEGTVILPIELQYSSSDHLSDEQVD